MNGIRALLVSSLIATTSGAAPLDSLPGTQESRTTAPVALIPHTVSPRVLDFGNQPVGITSAPLPVTFTNTGTETLYIFNMAIGSETMWVVFNDFKWVLQPGESTSLSFQFTPSGTQSYTDTVYYMMVLGPDFTTLENWTFQLTGTGVDP